MTTGLLLAAADEPNVTPGLLGFLVVAALGVATWLLLRSMRRQLRKISFDDAGQPSGPGAEGSAKEPDPAPPVTTDPPDRGGSAG